MHSTFRTSGIAIQWLSLVLIAFASACWATSPQLLPGPPPEKKGMVSAITKAAAERGYSTVAFGGVVNVKVADDAVVGFYVYGNSPRMELALRGVSDELQAARYDELNRLAGELWDRASQLLAEQSGSGPGSEDGP